MQLGAFSSADAPTCRQHGLDKLLCTSDIGARSGGELAYTQRLAKPHGSAYDAANRFFACWWCLGGAMKEARPASRQKRNRVLRLKTDDCEPIAIRPFLRWAGSKRNVLSQLVPLIGLRPNRYIEPFAGSASLFFRVQPKRAVLSDINPHLIETFRQIKRDHLAVHRAVIAIPRTKAEFLKRRSVHFSDRSGVDLASTFIYLNRNCFNGLYRTNKKGLFNVPYSNNRMGHYLSLDELAIVAKGLRHAQLHVGDFYDVVSESVRPGDIVYLDPPYAIDDKRVFSEYAYGYFSTKDIMRIESLLVLIDSAGGRFVLSYAENDIIRGIAEKWHARSISINRNISGFLSSRRKDRELIISNFVVGQ